MGPLVSANRGLLEYADLLKRDPLAWKYLLGLSETGRVSVAGFLLLVGRPPFKDVMRPKFQLDMGSLMLAFTLFWSYTSFSQFMLVWIGNLPEEIPFFLNRSTPTHGFWWWVSAALCVLP